MEIKKKDLKPYTVYVGCGGSNEVIFMPREDMKYFSDSYYISGFKNAFMKGSCNTSSDLVFRTATDKEDKWLRQCIAADKFIPLSEVSTIINNYQIY